MNVLLLTHRYPPDGIGGIERYTESIAAGLTAAGDRVTVLTRRPAHLPRRPRTVADAREDVRVLRVEGSGVRYHDPLARHEQTEQSLLRALVESEADIVHVNQLLGLSPRSIPLAKAAGCGVVVSLLDYFFACPLAHLRKTTGESCAGPDGGEECARTCFVSQRHARDRWILRARYFGELLRLSDRVLCPTRLVAEYFEGFAPGIKSQVFALGVEADTPDDRQPAVGPLRLLVVGSVQPQKGAHVVIDALALANLGPVELTVAGPIADSHYAEELRDKASRVSGLRFDLLGPVGRSELHGLLGRVDAFVFPSLAREVFPLAPREALAAGLPVVASRVGGLGEVITDGSNGLLVEPGDALALGTALRRLADEGGLIDRIRTNASETSVMRIDEHVQRLQEVYADVREQRQPIPDAREGELFEAFRRSFADAGRMRLPQIRTP
jgi:glycosyltransferase involved in cell wall biosynthesis